MCLKAPAAYWNAKASTHKTAEAKALGHLSIFFGLALVVLSVAFVLTGWAILRPGTTTGTPICQVARPSPPNHAREASKC